MPDGELPPNGLPARIVEFWADIYTEAVRPTFPMTVGCLIVVIVSRFAWRRRQSRDAVAAPPDAPRVAVSLAGPDSAPREPVGDREPLPPRRGNDLYLRGVRSREEF